MGLDAASLEAIDWRPLLLSLSQRARTAAGARAVLALRPLGDLSAVRAAHDAVSELLSLWQEGADLPIADVADVAALVRRASKGDVLDGGDLRLVRDAVLGLDALRRATDLGADVRPTLARLGDGIFVDPLLMDELAVAFDDMGLLSGRRWPELADLRERIQGLHSHIRSTLENILRGDVFADLLQDNFVTQRQDRYVVPVKSLAKRWDIGIVHGTSGSGQTVFVEPTEVVEANNRLRVAEGQLEALERRILAQLSRLVGAHAEALWAGLDAATALDVGAARAGLARSLDATRPQVGDRGEVSLRGARHPVLALRGVSVVPNDLSVGGAQPVLVLSGPNAGGKTVALKTIGLCAQLVRVGCFVPAAEGSRCDLFTNLLANIGDAQAIDEDLSSFTGQLAVLGAMLGRAGASTLLLLDEIATGTDPGQGAALAAAVIETLAERGGTVVATTHYAQLKGLAATTEGFAIAAVEFGGGTPTYRVVQGATGESHGLEVAARVGLPAEVLARADAHLGDTERTFVRALQELDGERDRLRMAGDELAAQRVSLASREASLAAREAEVAANAKALEAKAASGFRDRLRRAEAAISSVVADLQRSPDHAAVQRARATVTALGAVAPVPEGEEKAAPAVVAVGDRVRLRAGGRVGQVTDVRGARVTVDVGGLTVRVTTADVTVARKAAATAPPKRRHTKGKAAAPRRVPVSQAVRVVSNTLDLRGERVDVALDQVDVFLDRASLASWDAVFVLHGHGTGALKHAVRDHLKQSAYVDRAAPAQADQGGDAYTVAVLR